MLAPSPAALLIATMLSVADTPPEPPPAAPRLPMLGIPPGAPVVILTGGGTDYTVQLVNPVAYREVLAAKRAYSTGQRSARLITQGEAEARAPIKEVTEAP